MLHVILPNLKLLLVFVDFIIESSKKVLMRRLAIGSIIVYRNTIILNRLNNLADYIKFRVVKDLLT